MSKLTLTAGLIVLLVLILLLQNHKTISPNHSIKTIAITEIVEHPALDEARAGIMDTLKAAGYVPDKNIRILYENAQGNSQIATQIAHKLSEKSPDILVPISTQSTQTIVKANKNKIPVVFSTVTDPISAGIVVNLTHPGVAITGAMELPPIEKQLHLIKQLLPHVKRLGVIYSASETNSQATITRLKALSDLTIIERSINSSLDLKAATESLVNQVDAIYLPSDNKVWSALETVTKITTKSGIPVITADPISIEKGVVIALGYSQYDIGKTAGELIVRILKGESAELLPIQKPRSTTLAINLCAANKLHLIIPNNLIAQAHLRITDCKKNVALNQTEENQHEAQ